MISVLEFGAQDLARNSKQVWDIRSGQQAYDWFMAARYLQDLLTYQRLSQCFYDGLPLSSIVDDYKSSIHHWPIDLALNFDKYVAIGMFGISQRTRFYELGSTLFGCIEGITFVNSILSENDSRLDLHNGVEWVGVDNSSYLNAAAKQLHPNHHLRLFTHESEMTEMSSVFFAKGVSLLYALTEIEQLVGIIGRSEISIFDYTFMKGESVQTSIGTGKNVTYLNINDLYRLLPDEKVVYARTDKVQEDNEKLYCELIVGEKKIIDEFIGVQHQLLNQIKLKTPQLFSLMARTEGANIEWKLLNSL